ncbi:hypothetical protein [Myxococcus phage Mx4 ts27htf-1hrm-1]|nr:hypothetical protein Mx4_p19 [Myxococcus phage Mx4]WNM70360.1 hypothetical protein [Myxococcus phage Mx4 ts27htf-1hrm-1]
MTLEFPRCPKCEQCSVYPKWNDGGGEDFVCAACGHVLPYARRDVREQADAAVRRFGGVAAFERHWEAKLADERAKVARLAEGRW